MVFQSSYPDSHYQDYTFSADKKKLDLNYLYNMLCIPSRYSTGLPPERFPLVIENSLCFSIFYQDKQVGFARVITDFSEFASLWDLFIDEPHRRKGVGQALLKYLFNHPRLVGIFRWFLMTEDAHGLYQKFDFKTEVYNSYIMMKVNSI
ncbi:MAG TPA: GNAT family N-acetyltransferase [Gammaproteobacteria bacterium]|jgi:GNAT superfamily N-acetyltransferase|nr:GNAT family N-acetyltransferase [Gammaproteobacteria bacterium]